MPVNAKTVQGRRELNFATLDDVLADATQLVASHNTATLGNWPLEKLIAHLAMTFDGSIDGFNAEVPLVIRLIARLFKGSALKRKMSPGIKLPAKVVPMAFPEIHCPDEALELLRKAIARSKTEKMEAPHPAFGKMTHDEWLQLHLRHCEMHLSFAVIR
jgi:hypothetical protein